VRVLFVTWRDLANPSAGGSEVLVDRLATGLMHRGHQAAVLCGGPVGERPYPITDIGGTYSQYARAPVTYWRHFRKWDLVVDVENGVPFFAPVWRRREVVCLVHHLHRDQWAQRFPAVVARAGWIVEGRVMPWVYRRRMFLAVSPSTAGALEDIGIPRSRIRLITNGVDVPDAVAREDPDPLFLAIGRLVPHKRIDLLLRVWDRVRPSVGGRLVIVGSGPEEMRLRREAGPGVEFLGHVTDEEKLALLGRSWMLVHAAQHEGWGLVVLEAAAAARPTLAFDVPGVRDGIVDGETGVLIHTEAGMVREWVALATDHNRRHRLGAAARERAKAFGVSRTVDQFLDVAAELTGVRPRERHK
jgi:glycosyltransferase involved in cell wall biosynthesis